MADAPATLGPDKMLLARGFSYATAPIRRARHPPEVQGSAVLYAHPLPSHIATHSVLMLILNFR